MTMSLVPGDVTLAQLEDIWRHNEAIDLDSNVRETIDVTLFRICGSTAPFEFPRRGCAPT